MPVPPTGAPPETGLRQVLDLEAKLAADLEAARTEADAIRTAAVEAARQASRAADATARGEEEQLRARAEMERVREEARAREDLQSSIQALDRITPEQIEAIARGLLPLLVSAPKGAGP